MNPDEAIGRLHLRVARPTDRLEACVAFYRDALGLSVLSSFTNHDGFDGVMLGHEGSGYHIELTHKRDHKAGRAPTEDNLLVFYIPDLALWQRAVDRMHAHGHSPVASFNPYWDENGVTYEDPDGYRVVLNRGAWR